MTEETSNSGTSDQTAGRTVSIFLGFVAFGSAVSTIFVVEINHAADLKFVVATGIFSLTLGILSVAAAITSLDKP